LVENREELLQETIELLCLSLKWEQLSKLVSSLQQNIISGLQLSNKAAEKIRSKRQKVQQEMQKKKKEEKQKSKEEQAEWSAEELKALAKAVIKFPVGLKNRYTKIIEFMETKRTEKEIIKQIKKMNESKIDTKQFIKVENRNTRKGLNIDSGPKAALYEGEEEEREKVLAITQTQMQAFSSCKLNPSSPSIPALVANSMDAKNSKENNDTEEENWSLQEQAALEDGLKKYSSKEKERWQLISNLVVTKTKKECIKRYKFLVQRLKNK